MVFAASEGGVYRTLRSLTRWGLGGSMAGGHQFVSWIHEEDFCRAVEWIMEHDDISGAVNVAAPNPVTNAEFMASIRRVCGVRFGLPAPRWALEIGAFFMGTETEL